MKKRILIVKHGALGDVVRTSYFAKPIKESNSNIELHWWTSSSALEILINNPYIDQIHTSIDLLVGTDFDVVYSLDDEQYIVAGLSKLKASKISGAYIDDCLVKYTKDVSSWFDMGVHSIFGLSRANQLKKRNTKSHAEIFADIFGVNFVDKRFYFEDYHNHIQANQSRFNIGLFLHSGGRWPSKALSQNESILLIGKILSYKNIDSVNEIRLYGMGIEAVKNQSLSNYFSNSKIRVIRSDKSIQTLAANINELDVMITSDSLPMHLAIANDVYTIAYFTATSAAEIDMFNNGCKVISTASDYCSYRSDADNKSITAEILYKKLDAFIENSLC
jgi:heptosyltransferase II